MNSLNKAFPAAVTRQRNWFIELLHSANVGNIVYPSKHFFERVVERNLEALDVLRMITPVIHEFRGSSYNIRSYCIQWKQFRIHAAIDVGPVTGVRRIILKTVYDFDPTHEQFDVTIKI